MTLAEIVAKAESDLAPVAAAADEAIEKRLKTLLRQMAQAKTLDQQRTFTNAALDDIAAISEKFFGPSSEFAGRYKAMATAAAKEGFSTFAKQTAQIAPDTVKLKAIERDVRSLAKSAVDAYENAAANLNVEGVSFLRRTVKEAMLSGGDHKTLAERLEKSGFIGDLKITDKAGRTRTLRAETRAAMMARTEPKRISILSKVQQAGNVEPSAEDRIWRWVSRLGPEVGDDSLRRHGMMMSEKEWMEHDFGDGMFGLPPIRPNDQCSVIFYRRAWLTDEQKAAMGEPAGSDGRRFMHKGERKRFEKRQDGLKLKKAAQAKPKAPPQAPPSPAPPPPPPVPKTAAAPGPVQWSDTNLPAQNPLAKGQISSWTLDSAEKGEFYFQATKATGQNVLDGGFSIMKTSPINPYGKGITLHQKLYSPSQYVPYTGGKHEVEAKAWVKIKNPLVGTEQDVGKRLGELMEKAGYSDEWLANSTTEKIAIARHDVLTKAGHDAVVILGDNGLKSVIALDSQAVLMDGFGLKQSLAGIVKAPAKAAAKKVVAKPASPPPGPYKPTDYPTPKGFDAEVRPLPIPSSAALSEAERNTIRGWTGSGYSKIRAAQLAAETGAKRWAGVNITPELAKTAERFQRGLEKLDTIEQTMGRPATIFRGMRISTTDSAVTLWEKISASMAEGGIYTAEAASSYSSDPKVAAGFGGVAQKPTQGVIRVLFRARSRTGRYIAGLSGYRSESEAVVLKGTRFRIKKITKNVVGSGSGRGESWVIDMEEIK